MTNSTDFSYLSDSWIYWAGLAGLTDVSVSTDGDDYSISFESDDYSVHLRRDRSLWIVDTVDDRGQRHNAEAEFTAFELLVKYLVWTWADGARSARRAATLGRYLYSLGLDPTVQATPMTEGIVKLRSSAGEAILMEPEATIFSHLMYRPLPEIERMVGKGDEGE